MSLYTENISSNQDRTSWPYRQRVNDARKIQLQRFAKTKLHSKAQIGAKEIKRYCAVKADTEKLLETAIDKLGLRARAYSRVLKGRTIADLAGAEPEP